MFANSRREGDFGQGATNAILRTSVKTLVFLKVGGVVCKVMCHIKDSLWIALYRKGISPTVMSNMA